MSATAFAYNVDIEADHKADNLKNGDSDEVRTKTGQLYCMNDNLCWSSSVDDLSDKLIKRK